jgi:hypothetical protein
MQAGGTRWYDDSKCPDGVFCYTFLKGVGVR